MAKHYSSQNDFPASWLPYSLKSLRRRHQSAL
jgi:hypothetical protein